MAERIKVKCAKCGTEFERSVFHPYIDTCKSCRKGTGAFSGGNPKPAASTDGIVVKHKKNKGFQYLMDSANYGVKIKPCCIAHIKQMNYMAECTCGNCFRKVTDKLVGLGYGVYKVTDDNQLEIVHNWLEKRPSLKKKSA